MDNYKIEIARRWLENAKKNDNDSVDYTMDRFFSLYVAYNAIYSNFSKNKNDDRACATTRIADYLKKENITILNECKKEVLEMIKPVKEGLFYIYGNNSSRDWEQDNIIVSKIEEDINNYRAILNFIYGIRCNMFHGEKQIIAEQKKLLDPANIILEKLLEKLIEQNI